MIALRMLATLMAVMVAGSVAQSSSSSSSSSGVSSSAVSSSSSSGVSSSAASSSSSSAATGSSSNSSSSGISSGSSSSTGLLSSSSSSGAIIPGFNDSSSSSSVWIVSSSSTGAVDPNFFPAGTYQVNYMIELVDGIVRLGLTDALAQDFAATIAANPVYNTTMETVMPYIRAAVAQPPLNVTEDGQSLSLGAAANTTVNAVILGNITQVIAWSTEDIVKAFAVAAQNGSIVSTRTSLYGARVFPQEISWTEIQGDGSNGASSAVSASFLIATMIGALALAF